MPLPMGVPLGIPGMPMLQAGTLLVAQQTWQSPYPPPDAAERFEVLHPGTFGRILGMAEREQAARIAAGEAGLRYQRRDVARAQWLGSCVSLAALAAAVICAVCGAPWVGAACVSVPVMAVALALVQSARAPIPTIGVAAPVATPPPPAAQLSPPPGQAPLPPPPVEPAA